MMDQQPVDVVVVGAGLAGLCAARRLVARGYSVQVLEARARVGGRTLSHPLGNDVVDLGAQWVGPGQDRIMALAREFGVGLFGQYNTGRKVLAIGDRVTSYRNTIPSLPVASLVDLQLAINSIEKLCQQVPLDRPFDAPRAAEWDSWTVESWKQRHIRTAAARAVLDGAVRSIFAAEPCELSFLHFLFYLHSGGGLLRLAEIKNGAQQDRFVGGAQQIARRLAAQLGERVLLNTPVRAITQHPTDVTIHTLDRTFAARYCVVAIPPTLAGRIDYQPALPALRDQLTQRMPMGAVIKCVVAYPTPWWRAKGFSGEALSDRGPIQLVFDDSPYDAEYGALVGFMLGGAAREWSGHTRAERAQAVRGALVRLFGPQAATPLAYIDQDWSAEQWSRGCYVGVMPPGAQTQVGAALHTPVGRIHWAGTETAQHWNGYMDGAIESGERVANELTAKLGQRGSEGASVAA